MVYVNPDGTITTTQPWGINKIMAILLGFINFIILFCKSLVGLENYSISGNSGNSRSTPGGSGGSNGGGWGGPGGGGGPKRGPGPRGKRFFTMRDIAPPSVGGCAGGSCPR